MFRRQEVVGVDIGSSSVKVVKLRRSSAYWIVTNAGITDISEKGAESPARRESNRVRALLNCVRLSGVKTRLAVCGVGGQEVAVRNFTFPAVPPEEIDRVVELEAKQVCPFNADEIAVDYRLLPDGPGKTTGYLVIAAGHLVKTKNRLAKKGRLDCALMDADALALLNCFKEMENPPEDHGTAILNIGHLETTFAVEGNKGWPFVRSVNYAGDMMIRAIAAENETTLEAVKAVFAGDPKEIPQPMHESLERACERLITDITKTVRYYGAQEGSFDIHKVLVCGGFSLFGDLAKLLGKHLPMEVVLWNPFTKMRLQIPRNHRGALLKSVLRKSGPTMAVAAGLAMRTV
ncbi:MAG: pilus assembly protein PilM [Phycisphaerales bacterium]|nr:MAG: pilus assembly protein PilM [Phycisphaerales bacterium]